MHSFIFIGRSGCGKGTQASLLTEFLKKKTDAPMLYIETGEEFRKFINSPGYANTLSKKVYENADRQPDFLASYMWMKILLDKCTGKENVIFDGTPRSLPEAKILETALSFYGFEKPVVVYLNVSREWSRKHLLTRGRADDVSFQVEKRLDWFERDVLPAIEYFRNNPYYGFCEISGEQQIDAVHSEIIEKTSIYLNG